MVCFPGLVLATIILLVPGSDSQCLDCEKKWNAFCNATETGYYCMPGTIISKVEIRPEELATSSPHPSSLFAKCVPHPYVVDYIQGWCCFWSKSVGCQAAMHPHVYEQGYQSRFCEKCRTLCICKTDGVSAVSQPWQWTHLVSCTIFILYFSSYLSQRSNLV